MLLEKDGGPGGPSHAVWLQTNFFVGSGNNKGSSFINIALGEWSAQGGITGFRRGGSIVLGPNENSAPQTYSFSGDIASLAGPDSQGTLSQFMGSDNPNIVIGANSTGTHNIFRDTPLNPIYGENGNSRIDQQTGATYHVGIGSGPIQPIVGQHSATMQGFAAGFAQHPGSGSSDFVANFSPSDLTLNFDATTNTMTGSFKLKQVTPSVLDSFKRCSTAARNSTSASAAMAVPPSSTTTPSLRSRKQMERRQRINGRYWFWSQRRVICCKRAGLYRERRCDPGEPDIVAQ